MTAARSTGAGSRAFTLIEVMIAAGILFLCLFAILALLANSLRNARALQRRPLDAGMAAAQLYAQLTSTNQAWAGRGSGDFGDLYPHAKYEFELTEIATNGLCQLDVWVRERDQPTDSRMTLLLFLPNLRRTR
jgi:Tfp pilus assembly protein PilV